MGIEIDGKLDLVESAILNFWRWELGSNGGKKRKRLSLAKFAKMMTPSVSASTVKRWLEQKFAVEHTNHRAQLLRFINTVSEENQKAAAYGKLHDLDDKRTSLWVDPNEPYARIQKEMAARWPDPPKPVVVPPTYEQLEYQVQSLTDEVRRLNTALAERTEQLEQMDAAWFASYQRMSTTGKLTSKPIIR
ncbi:MAG: hypothetical protein RL095_1329 [Verrucomicrobiota bacterium]|jgi:hypothetical protein